MTQPVGTIALVIGCCVVTCFVRRPPDARRRKPTRQPDRKEAP